MKGNLALHTSVLFMALHLASAEMGFEGGYWRRAASGGQSTFVIPLEMDKSGFYHSAVSMGSNKQLFNFSLSGSTGYTVVAGSTCTACGDQNPLYSSANSTTFQSMAELLSISVDGVNQVFGNLAKEDCALKRSDGNWWAYTNQTVLVANSVNDGTRDVFNTQISGIVGLHPTAKVHTAADTVLGAWLRKNPQAEKVSVGFALKRPGILPTNATATGNSTAAPSSTSGGGEMHMLAPDNSSYVGNLNAIPTVSYSASGGSTSGNGGGAQMQAAGWVTNLEQWSFLNSNGEQLSGGKGAFAAVDPWYSGIIMPKAESENVFAKVPGAQLVAGTNAAQQSWNIPCNTRMNLTIKIAGLEFDIDPRDLIVQGEMTGGSARKRQQDALCPCNVQGWTDATVPGYMLGSSFMRNAYIVYNVAQSNSSQSNSIGFAQRHPFRLPTAEQSQRSRTIAVVVGSIAGTLLLIGGVALAWLWRRNRLAHRAPSEEFVKGNSKRFEYGGLNSTSTFFAKGGTAVAPGVIFTARRGSDPEAYPLMQTPPTTSSPPRDGSRPKTFAQQQGPIVHVEDADRHQEIDHDAHQAYLDRLSKHAQGRGVRWSSSPGYSRVADQDVDVHAFGDHAQVYDGHTHEPDQRYDPPAATTWDQPYHPPAPAAGSRVSMAVEPITRPPGAAQKEEPGRAI